MEITLSTYLIVLPFVFLASIIDSISGGGGLISLPAYTSLAGLDYGFASGCNKFSACFGTMAATFRYIKSGKVLLKPALITAACALPAAWIGTRVSFLMSNRAMSVFMLISIPLIAAVVLVKKPEKIERKELTRSRLLCCVPVGLALGFYDGFYGPGTGTFLMIIYTYLIGMDMVSASATSKPVNLASNLMSLATRIAAGQVIYKLAVPAMCLSVLGGFLGAKLALTKGARFIRFVLLIVLALLLVKIITDLGIF